MAVDRIGRVVLLGAILAALLGPAGARSEDASELAKKVQNPIGSLISLPFESNFNFENGTDDDSLQYVLNIQPVVPFSISDGWNLITRPIIPLISQDGVAQVPPTNELLKTGDRTFGLGDITLSLFLSPKSEGKFTWGAGPVVVFPTATDDALGSDKWSAGPTAVALYKTGPWLFGGLVGQFWSFAGDDDRRDVSTFYIQPFLNYNLPQGWYLTSSPLISANWKAKSGEEWRVPVGGGVGKVFRIGNQNINTRLVASYNVERPTGSADWSIQWTLQFLFPK